MSTMGSLRRGSTYRSTCKALLLGVLLLWVPSNAMAQEATSDSASASAPDTTRAEEWRQKRLEKAEDLRHPRPGFFERVATDVEAFVDRNQLVLDLPLLGFGGLEPVLGGLQSGSGYTGGLRYEWFRERPGYYANVEALASLRRYWGVQSVVGYEDEWWVGYGYARYWHMPELPFYGIGPNTPRSYQTTFRLNEAILGGLVGWNPLYNTLLGGHVSYVINRYGPGQNDDYPTPEEAPFIPDDLPGLGADVDYIVLSGYAEFDTRNVFYEKAYGSRFAPTEDRLRGISLSATRGIYFATEVTHHIDAAGGHHDFTRIDLETQEYIPVRRGFQVLTLRQFASFTSNAEGNDVPFYRMRTLGGAHTLRGFGGSRFRDRNVLLFNTEFRWQVMHFLDMALFSDAGHVFHRVEDMSLTDLEMGYGVGFRAKQGQHVLARLDIAYSREGVSFYLKLGSVL